MPKSGNFSPAFLGSLTPATTDALFPFTQALLASSKFIFEYIPPPAFA